MEEENFQIIISWDSRPMACVPESVGVKSLSGSDWQFSMLRKCVSVQGRNQEDPSAPGPTSSPGSFSLHGNTRSLNTLLQCEI